MITAVLNTYRRLDYLADQIAALKAQTVPPVSIAVWRNDDSPDDQFAKVAGGIDSSAKASQNLGVFPRFALALLAQTEYVAIFDDDCIPGRRWFEACLAAIEREDGLYGVNGARFRNPNRYHSFELFGVRRPGYKAVEVDIVGHCWFLRRDNLSAIFDFPAAYPTAGEDMALSFAMQRLRLRTYAMAHPPGQLEFWGSVKPELNRDGRGINRRRELRPQFDSELQRLRGLGWKLLCEAKAQETAHDNHSPQLLVSVP